MKNTHGPWMVTTWRNSTEPVVCTEYHPIKNRTYGCACDNRFVCDFDDGDYHNYEEEAKEEKWANAYLVSASPEMYEKLESLSDALDEMLKLIIGGEDIPDTIIACFQDEVDKAREVLKKARGDDFEMGKRVLKKVMDSVK